MDDEPRKPAPGTVVRRIKQNPNAESFVVERVRRRRKPQPPAGLLLGALLVLILGAGGVFIARAGGLQRQQAQPAPAPTAFVAAQNTEPAAASAPAAASPTGAPSPTVTLSPTPADQPDFIADDLAGLPGQPTSILPDAYILSLSATPIPDVPTPTPVPASLIQPTFTPAFVPATPALDRRTSLIVFVCRIRGSDEICTINADGSNLRQLTSNRGTDWYPSLSPDGQWIVYSSQRNGQFDIHIMDINGENNRQITRGMGENYAPCLSPDGSKIVFTSTYHRQFGEGRMQHIWTVNLDGSNPTQITDGNFNDIDPTWSPDGSQISFTSGRSGTNELHVMMADGSNVRQITVNASLGGRNDWSHDGRYFSFYAGPPGRKEIWLMDASCAYTRFGCIGQPYRLTNGGHNKGPSFSPDSQWVVYASQRDPDHDNEVFITRVDGSETYQLTFNTFPDWQARWSY